MKRKAILDLVRWKEDSERKPLIVYGARRVGKTWLVKEFGEKYYQNTVYVNFADWPELKELFEVNKDPRRILELLSIITGERILPGETLLIFDEIQECEAAYAALKYFKEDAGEYHVIAVGSLPGTYQSAFAPSPVGMVNLLYLRPLTFTEFLAESDPALHKYYEGITKNQRIEKIFHHRLNEACDTYLLVGGMPECAASWIQFHDMGKVSLIQQELVKLMENDFSRCDRKGDSTRLLQVFRSIVPQLAKPNEKFMYGCVRKGGRARDFEFSVERLVSLCIANRVYNVSGLEHPLAAFERQNQFKLYLFDTGLLKTMAGIRNHAILLKEDYWFKGALEENFVLQQLCGQFAVPPHYYADKNHEIDFLLQEGSEIIPVEVGGIEGRISPSFKRLAAEKRLTNAIIFSRDEYGKEGEITKLPLYLACKTRELL